MLLQFDSLIKSLNNHRLFASILTILVFFFRFFLSLPTLQKCITKSGLFNYKTLEITACPHFKFKPRGKLIKLTNSHYLQRKMEYWLPKVILSWYHVVEKC